MPIARSLTIVSAAALALTSAAASAPGGNAGPLALQGDINPAHDPVLIRAGGTYYSYSTGRGHRLPLVARASSDLINWHELPSPLPAIPAWALAKVPGARDIWAPDISKVDGRYRLYYAVSTFGSQTSVIGLATSTSLDPSSRDYGWKDEGLDSFVPDEGASASDTSEIPSGHFGVASSVPGNIWKILVEDGAHVEAGQAVAIIESMKMEITVTAHAAGAVRDVRAGPGRNVKTGDVIIVLEEI